MKTNKKSILKKYYCDIYDVDIIIANKYVTAEQIKKSYTYYDGVIIKDNTLIDNPAVVCKVRNIKTGRYCILIKFNRDSRDETKEYLINTISHEALHVALDIYELIQQEVYFSSPEPLCYLVGWVSECIYKTVMK